MIMEKCCTLCLRLLPEDKFWFRNRETDSRMSRCKECLSTIEKNYRVANVDKCKARWREYYHRPEVREKRLKQHKEWANAGDGRYKLALKRSRVASKRNGSKPCTSTPDIIKASFSGICEICGKTEVENGRKLSMDHDHETGEFRGWVCWTCNSMLGLARDSSEILKKAVKYLEKPKVQKLSAS